MAEHEAELVHPESAYERSDWTLAAIGIAAFATIALLIIAPLVLRASYGSADSDRRLLVVPPAPELQIDSASDLARYRAGEEARLQSYGWVDRDKGIVHIPIEQAMRDLAKRGIDGFPRGQK
jgi:hypothetical protein